MTKNKDKILTINTYGDYEEFDIKFSFFLDNRKLKSIEYPNHKEITNIDCSLNELTELILPHNVKVLYCDRNQLTSLELPQYVFTLHCDKELFDYDKCIVEEVHIFYE